MLSSELGKRLVLFQELPNHLGLEGRRVVLSDHGVQSILFWPAPLSNFLGPPYYADLDSIRTFGKMDTSRGWEERKRFLLPMASPSMEYLMDQNDQLHTSLGLIRPKEVRRLLIKKETPEWSAEELAKLRQRSLMDGLGEDGTYKVAQDLEKIPFRFQYEFVCDEPRCHGHIYAVISWEVLQSYRKWRTEYGEDRWEAAFRQKYENEFLSPQRDLHFYVGTVLSHPKTWTIIGLFYPPSGTTESQVIQPTLL